MGNASFSPTQNGFRTSPASSTTVTTQTVQRPPVQPPVLPPGSTTTVTTQTVQRPPIQPPILPLPSTTTVTTQTVQRPPVAPTYSPQVNEPVFPRAPTHPIGPSLPSVPTHPIGPSFPAVPTHPIQGGVTRTSQIQDIQNILKKMELIEDTIDKNIKNWRSQTVACPNMKKCNNNNQQACIEEPKKPYDKSLQGFCNDPLTYIANSNFQLTNWLNTTIQVISQTMAMTPNQYYTHMVSGLRYIYNYVVVIPYLINEASFFASNNKNIQTFQKYLFQLIVYIAGCQSNFTYKFLYEFSQMPAFSKITTINSPSYNPEIVQKYNAVNNICINASQGRAVTRGPK